MKHFDLSGKRAVVLGSTPPATVIAEAYEEAGASVFKIESVSSITGPILSLIHISEPTRPY